MDTALEVLVEKRYNVNVVRCIGEIDLSSVAVLQERLHDLTGLVSIDLAEVTFLGSTGIGVIAAAKTAIETAGGKLRLHAPRENVRRVIETVGLSDWISDYSVVASVDRPALPDSERVA